jgi:NAD(P)-dependent dehydrogenase (short-subunit alcohol dehydrogenase family)
MSDLSGRTTVVVGASRGLGRGIARAFAEAGAPVVAVARTGPALAELATTSANIRTEVADAADATVAWSMLDQYEPEVRAGKVERVKAAVRSGEFDVG